MKRYCILIVLLCSAAMLQAQTIKGWIIDSSTRKGIPGVSVYFNNTTAVAVTNDQGFFELPAVTGGELVTSHVSYITRRMPLQALPASRYIALQPSLDVLSEVVVKTKTKDTWKKWGDIFSENFIGGENDRRYCKLLNPEDLSFYYDKTTMILRARARKPLLLSNKILGYTLHVDLDHFEYSFRTGVVQYITSSFYEWNEGSDDEKRQAAAGRLMAYNGSQMHFIRALYSNTLAQEGFQVYTFKGHINPERARVQSLVLHNKALQLTSGSGIDVRTLSPDSLQYYKNVLRQPAYLDFDTTAIRVNDRLSAITADGYRSFQLGADTLMTIYDGDQDRSLPLSHLRRISKYSDPFTNTAYDFFQDVTRSTVLYSIAYTLGADRIAIEKKGGVLNADQLYFEGYLSGRRMAFSLPWDYDPRPDRLLLGEKPRQEHAPAEAEATPAAMQRIADRLRSMSKRFNNSDLYLHLDKNIYAIDEHIWFTGYITRTNAPRHAYQTLHVFLANRSNGRVVAAEKFPMRNGIGAGYLFLEDSLASGDYDLYAYTDRYNSEAHPKFFRQRIRLSGYALQATPEQKRTPSAHIQKDSVRLNWYPEGGDLVAGLPCTLVAEARFTNGKPASVKGLIESDGKPCAEFETDGSGLARFVFTPAPGRSYSASVTGYAAADAALPEVQQQGYAITLKQGVVLDTAIIGIRSARTTGPAYLLLHDYRNGYALRAVAAADSNIALPLGELPPGLATITLFDAQGYPVAERSIFRQTHTAPHLEISIDSSGYHQRARVHVHLKLTSADGKPLSASLSAACVSSGHLVPSLFRDIVTFSRTNGYDGMVLPAGNTLASLGNNYLETFLLTQCWTRYRWRTLENTPETSAGDSSLMVHGLIRNFDRSVKDRIALNLMGTEGIHTVFADSTGRFVLEDSLLNADPDSKVNISLNKKNKYIYNIIFTDPNDVLQRNMAALPVEAVAPDSLSDALIHSNEFMAPVIIRGRSAEESRLDEIYISNTCKDWVCMNNVLNCIHHNIGHKAIPGESYRVLQPNGEYKRIIYLGCASGKDPNLVLHPEGVLYRIKGRYYNKEFYPSDYARYNPPVPETETTQYWNPQLFTNAAGEADFTFYTNDLVRPIQCVIQGWSAAGPVAAQIRIDVK